MGAMVGEQGGDMFSSKKNGPNAGKEGSRGKGKDQRESGKHHQTEIRRAVRRLGEGEAEACQCAESWAVLVTV